MTSLKQSLKLFLVVQFLAVFTFAPGSASSAVAQDQKPEAPAPASSAIAKPARVIRPQKSAAACGKTATLAQLSAIAAKLREFQAKQQARNAKDSVQPSAQEQVTNRKP
jgi:hypothetical protein